MKRPPPSILNFLTAQTVFLRQCQAAAARPLVFEERVVHSLVVARALCSIFEFGVSTLLQETNRLARLGFHIVFAICYLLQGKRREYSTWHLSCSSAVTLQRPPSLNSVQFDMSRRTVQKWRIAFCTSAMSRKSCFFITATRSNRRSSPT